MNEVKIGRLGPFPRVSKPVFIASSLFIVCFIIFGALFTEQAFIFFDSAQAFITDKFGWFFIFLVNATVLFCLYIPFSKYGDIRLGHQTEQPQYSLFSWVGMLFSAGLGIGLIYYGTAEPLYHFLAPPMGEAETIEAAKQAMNITFLHFGLHGWALYAFVGLALAYFHYRRGLPLSIRSTLYPILGEKIYGFWGHVVDTLAVFGTMFGVVTSLGLGAQQINSGLALLFDMPNNMAVQFGIIALITTFATISVMLGLNKGIKRLSDINIVIAVLLLLFMIVFGPTLFIFDSFIENTGNYIAAFVPLGFWTEAWSKTDWQGSWTIFYWAWWVSWAPFVGVFVARVSRGRTLREFTLGIMFIPLVILFLWFTTFGGVAINMELMGNPGFIEALNNDFGSVVFKFLEGYPMAQPLTMVVILMIMLWFVTSSDSASFVIDMLTAGGDTNPPKIQRLFWAISEGLIAAILLSAGGLAALQAAAIVAGFPFAIVIVVMMYALIKGLRRDRLILYRTEQSYTTAESVERHSANEFTDEHLLKGPPEIASGD